MLPLVLVLAALTGCSSSGSDKPDGAWALSLCKRVLRQSEGDAGAGPLGFDLVEGRAVTKDEARKLGGRLPTGPGVKDIRFAASCKIRFTQPKLVGIRKSAHPALLAFEGGSNTFVDDPYWAK